jgi:hypothetical protein
MKICICSSIKYKDDILKVSEILNDSNISHHLPVMDLPKDLETPEMTPKLVYDHFDKIRESEIILVVNPTGYFGNSVKVEIGFAKGLGKKVIFLERTNQPELDCLADDFVSIEQLNTLGA